MASYEAVSKNKHQNLSWQENSDFKFSSDDLIVSVVGSELTKVIMHLPLAFVPFEESYTLVAVLGILDSKNLQIDGEGKWLGDYIPQIYQYHPFKLGVNENKEYTLCIADDYPLLERGKADNCFFDEAGEASAKILEVFSALQRYEADKLKLNRICTIFKELDLLKPWDIKVQTDAGLENFEGLYCLDEAKLNALEDDKLSSLRKGGGLLVAYAQLFSMYNINRMWRYRNIKPAPSRQPVETLAGKENLTLGQNNGIISFENF